MRWVQALRLLEVLEAAHAAAHDDIPAARSGAAADARAVAESHIRGTPRPRSARERKAAAAAATRRAKQASQGAGHMGGQGAYGGYGGLDARPEVAALRARLWAGLAMGAFPAQLLVDRSEQLLLQLRSVAVEQARCSPDAVPVK